MPYEMENFTLFEKYHLQKGNWKAQKNSRKNKGIDSDK